MKPGEGGKSILGQNGEDGEIMERIDSNNKSIKKDNNMEYKSLL